MFNAAVPSEAIDGSLQSTSDAGASFSSYVPPAWRSYPHLSWAANWFRWFVDDAEDARGSMGWPDRFASALDNAGEVYNYYSTGDEIFHNTASPPWLLEGMGESSANYSWQKQETLKGSSLPGGTLYGGWGFHSWSGDLNPDDYTLTTVRYTPEEAASMVAGATVTNTPVFNRGYAPMLSRDASQEEVFMALAKYVPAVSSAVGGVHLDRNVDENINMNSVSDINGIPRPNGWGRRTVDDSNPWKHSDMKDVAYYYVFKLYQQLKLKGCLE